MGSTDNSGPSDRLQEVAILAAILQDPTRLHDVGNLDAKDFADSQLGFALFTAQMIQSEGRRLSPTSLRIEMGLNSETFDSDVIGALQAHRAGGDLDIAALAAGIRANAQRRKLLRISERLNEMAWGHSNETPRMAATEAMGELDEVMAAERIQDKTYYTMTEASDEFIHDLQHGSENNWLSTGFKKIDDIAGGLPLGEMTLVAGRPSMGKSAFAVALAMSVASRGRGVLFFSQEMTVKNVMARAASRALWKPGEGTAYSNIRHDRVKTEDLEAIVRATLDRVAPLPLDIEVMRGHTAASIAGITRRAAQSFAKRGTSLAAVFVDHLGLMQASSRY